MKILITGGSGKLGTALRKVYPDALAPRHTDFDITDKDKVFEYIKKEKPDVVIHTAAFTSVAKAETEHEACWTLNVRGTENLVEALRTVNPKALFIYIGTACVFYGDRGMYTENDIPHPKNFYAFTKLVGEYVARRMPEYLIARTNFVAREPWPYPKAFTDRFGTYLFADDVACALKDLIEENTRGLVHIAGDKKMSMYELAKLTTPNVGEMTMKETNLPLTVDMTLKSAKIKPFKIGA